MAFIMDLLISSSYNSIFIILDLFTKMAYFSLYTITITSKETIILTFDNILCYRRLQKNIISNRETQFVSRF